MSLSVQDTWRKLGEHMAALAPDREWITSQQGAITFWIQKRR
jgi:hypothetical protein